jgi:outer membrane protein assembly factor BamB
MVWEHSYPGWGNETYSTPTVHDGRVYTLGRFGQLLCFDAASGRIVWNKNLVKDFGGKRPYYGYACSPLLVRDVLVVECGGKEALVLGLDAKTGQPRWKCGKGEAGFASPVSYEFGGQHANHGFFLYGDSNDYMSMYTPRVKDIKLRPALMVVYEPRK